MKQKVYKKISVKKSFKISIKRNVNYSTTNFSLMKYPQIQRVTCGHTKKGKTKTRKMILVKTKYFKPVYKCGIRLNISNYSNVATFRVSEKKTLMVKSRSATAMNF